MLNSIEHPSPNHHATRTCPLPFESWSALTHPPTGACTQFNRFDALADRDSSASTWKQGGRGLDNGNITEADTVSCWVFGRPPQRSTAGDCSWRSQGFRCSRPSDTSATRLSSGAKTSYRSLHHYSGVIEVNLEVSAFRLVQLPLGRFQTWTLLRIRVVRDTCHGSRRHHILPASLHSLQVRSIIVRKHGKVATFYLQARSNSGNPNKPTM